VSFSNEFTSAMRSHLPSSCLTQSPRNATPLEYGGSVTNASTIQVMADDRDAPTAFSGPPEITS
jgi:hypothetical protein